MEFQTYLLIIYFLVLLGYVLYRRWWQPFLKQRRAKKIVPSTLLSLMENGGGRIETIGEGDELRYNYEYQDGYFRITPEGKLEFSIIYPVFFSTDRENLEAVRNLANRANQNFEGWNFFYDFNAKTNEICVSLATRMTLAEHGNSDALFRETLRRCFSLRHHFVATFYREQQEESDEREINSQRDKYLLRMREYISQPEKTREELSGREVGQLLKVMGEYGATQPLSLDVYGALPNRLTVPTEILSYDLANALIQEDEDGKRVFAARHAVAVLTYKYVENHFSTEKESLQLTIALEAASQERDTLFFRACIARPALPEEGNLAFIQQSNENLMQTFLLAYDGGTLAAKEAEVRYMWGDAKDKVKERKFEELTEEQRLLLMAEEQPLGNSLYWGRKLSLSGRYAEAIVLFEHAYDLLSDRFEQLSENEKDTFSEVLYHLSFCYTALGNYAVAYFYISGLQNSKNPRYQQEFINTLVNMGDYRSLSAIDRVLRRMDSYTEQQPEIEEEVNYQKYRSFLYRRRLQALMNASLLDEAEAFAYRLRSREDCRSFAEEQLQKIELLRDAAALLKAREIEEEEEDEADESFEA